MYKNLQIHTPLSFFEKEGRKNVKIETEMPIIFLAGPIRNARNGMMRLSEYFSKKTRMYLSPAQLEILLMI